MIGFVDLGISGLNAQKINKIDKSLGVLSSEIYNSNMRIETNLEEIRKAQIAGLYGMLELHSSLEKLDQTQNEILKELKRQDREEDELGNLKFFLINVESELERILSISEEHPEYATMLAHDLQNSLLDNNITLNRFKRLDFDGMKFAKRVIESVSETANSLLERLG